MVGWRRFGRRHLTAAALAAGLVAGCGGDPPPPPSGALDVAEALGGDRAGFARALEPRPLRFPEDHGPHPDFRTEWWYLTGNLETAEGRHFGYQATFFRTALSPEEPERASGWATRQLYMAHFALTDTAAGTFHSFERFGRGAQGLAGARAEPLRVWLEDWELAAEPGAGLPPSAAGDPVLPPLTLRLAAPGVGLDLRLAAAKPIVLHGDRGLSAKGASAGNASYYYSFTRLETRGTVRVADREVAVEGASWMDREWSTSVLEAGVAGWDWLSLQLDDGADLMVFRLRRDDGAAGWEGGTLVAPDGASRALTGGEVRLEVLRRWTSPATGGVYPAAWRLSLAAEGLELEIEPRLAAQELAHTFVYWEGAVTAAGARRGRPVAGAGYVELTGYAAGGTPRGGTQG